MWDRRTFGWIGVAGVVAAPLAFVGLLYHPSHGVPFVPSAVLLLVAPARHRSADRRDERRSRAPG